MRQSPRIVHGLDLDEHELGLVAYANDVNGGGNVRRVAPSFVFCISLLLSEQ